jgi:hypothetical protein
MVFSVVKRLFWLWLLILIVLNIIPLSSEVNRSLSRNMVFDFRLDYLAHTAMMLFSPLSGELASAGM